MSLEDEKSKERPKQSIPSGAEVLEPFNLKVLHSRRRGRRRFSFRMMDSSPFRQLLRPLRRRNLLDQSE